MSDRATTQTEPRQVMPDLVRAFALLGIAVVNSVAFAYPFELGTFAAQNPGPTDQAATFGLYWLAGGKFYALFSMMFGASLLYQHEAAERAGARFSRRQTRRLVALAALGLVHYAFLFEGDILVAYALLGALLLTQLQTSQRGLLLIGACLILLQVAILALFGAAFLGLEAFKPGFLSAKLLAAADDASAAFTSPDFLDDVRHRLAGYGSLLPGVLMSQGIATFGYFCIGLALARQGAIAAPSDRIWRRARLLFLSVGLSVGALGAWVFSGAQSAADGRAMLGLAILFLAAPFQSLGYAGWLAVLAERPGRFIRFMSRAGQASLSAYLLQSVFLATVFSGWGFGLYAALSPSLVITTGALAGLASIFLTATWMTVFQRGPVETAFRAWTYG